MWRVSNGITFPEALVVYTSQGRENAKIIRKIYPPLAKKVKALRNSGIYAFKRRSVVLVNKVQTCMHFGIPDSLTVVS